MGKFLFQVKSWFFFWFKRKGQGRVFNSKTSGIPVSFNWLFGKESKAWTDFDSLRILSFLSEISFVEENSSSGNNHKEKSKKNFTGHKSGRLSWRFKIQKKKTHTKKFFPWKKNIWLRNSRKIFPKIVEVVKGFKGLKKWLWATKRVLIPSLISIPVLHYLNLLFPGLCLTKSRCTTKLLKEAYSQDFTKKYVKFKEVRISRFYGMKNFFIAYLWIFENKMPFFMSCILSLFLQFLSKNEEISLKLLNNLSLKKKVFHSSLL